MKKPFKKSVKKDKQSLKLKAKKGFTLIELMISIFIFVLFLATVSNAYISVVRSQKQANEIRKMYSEVRSFVQELNQEIKLNAIDYACYEGGSFVGGSTCPAVTGVTGVLSQGKTPLLYLVNKNGLEKTAIFFDKNNATVKMVKAKLVNKIWESDDEQTLFSSAVKISNLDFWVFPNVDPYSNNKEIYLNYKTQFQPKVTVFLSAENAVASMPDFSMDFQTTISSRAYNR